MHKLYRHGMLDRMIQFVKNYPDDTECDNRERVRETIDQDDINLMFDNWHNANYAALNIKRQENSVVVERPARTRGTIIVQRQQVNAAKDAINDALLALAIKMTFGECAKAGGKFARLAKHGKPTEVVGKKLTEKQVHNIWSRKE